MVEPVVLGDCTLYLADCLEVLPTLAAGSIDTVVSDPPYNVGINYSDKVNDKLKVEEYQALVDWHSKEYERLSGGNVVLILGSKRKILYPWWSSLDQAELIIVRMGAVSDKKTKNLTLQYHSILTTVDSNTGGRNLWEDIRWPGEGYFFNEERYGHPAMTPLRLAKRLVSYFSPTRAAILDPFMGSGTVGVACVQTGRRFIGIEIDERYFEIAVKRIRQAQLQIRMEI